MSRPQEPMRSPADLWTLLGEHPTQRHNDMLAERLHHLAGIPDRRPHHIRRLVLHLESLLFRPPARVRRREATRVAPAGRPATS
jgi:hypothetical protein